MKRPLRRLPAVCRKAFIFLWAAAAAAGLGGCGSIELNRGVTVPPPIRRGGGDFVGHVVDGLHVTGRPVTVDPATYRLTVSGNVRNELSLSLDEVRAMPAVSEKIDLVCPGVFVDKGTWTGVPLRTILEKAGLGEGSDEVVFTSLDGRYHGGLPVEQALGDGVLIAYAFDGKPFDRLNGFPLRLVAKNKPGYLWVKWLGRIEVER